MSHTLLNRKNSTSVGALAMLFATSGAMAQASVAGATDATNKDADPDTIIVTGTPYAVERAIATKRQLNIVSDSISASEIGSIPEFGLGEALQRVSGVSFLINNGRGEAQFATLRGLNPDYNSVTVDGIQLPSTEETRRQISFDVLPSILANQVNVYKTYQADLPSDAVGGVVNLRTHSAFDHPGFFIAGHTDFAYWQNRRLFHSNPVSGQADLRVSKTFGPNDTFGFVILGSYYRRVSNSLNTFSLPYSYYPYAGGTQTVSAVTLRPTTDVNGLIAIPDRRRWFQYDNIRERPGVFAKLEYNQNGIRAHISGGFFEHQNSEQRYSAYLNRGAATATFTAPDNATFATGTFDTDYDTFNQYRTLRYIEGGVGYDLDPRTRIDATINYARGAYRQDTVEAPYLTTTTATSAPVYVGVVGGAPLLLPVNRDVFANPANYLQSYFLTATDRSITKLPQVRIDLLRSPPPGEDGLGFGAGYLHRQLKQSFFNNVNQFNTLPAARITLATTGQLGGSITPPDSDGLQLPFVDGATAERYFYANPQNYVAAANNLQRSTLNNFFLNETIDAVYGQVSYHSGAFFAQAGLRYEWTQQDITNFQPDPIGSTTNFAAVANNRTYRKPLPVLNASYDISSTLKLRGAISRTLARARYSDLAQNQSLTLSGTNASLTIANPDLRARTSANYDLSLEYYPNRAIVLSAAVFQKDVDNEIVTLTTTTQNTTLPGFAGSNFTLTTTQSVNAGKSRIRGVELGANIARLTFLPGVLSNFGISANATFIGYDAPTIQMSDLVTFRQLPQLLESTKFVGNAQLFYRGGRFNGAIAYNHTGRIPTVFDRTNAVNDQYYLATNTVDAQLAYQFYPGAEFRVQAKNFTNERNRRFVGPTQNLNNSSLDNGAAYYAGFGFAF